MTLDDAPPPTRRSRRPRSTSAASASENPASDGATGATAGGVATAVAEAPRPTPAPPVRRPAKQAPAPRLAFAWVDEQAVARAAPAASNLSAAASPYLPVEPALLSNPPRRSPFRPGVLIPIAVIALVIGAYSATTLLWPLHAVAPTVASAEVAPIAAPAATLTWPSTGSASVAVAGINGVVTSSPDAVPIASITKLVTALAVLDQMPLALGEQGPEFRFSYSDRTSYWGYRDNGESALDVPVGGALTEYQMLEGMLVGSANNYADRLAGNLWPTDAVFADAANTWLTAHGVTGITVVEPTGLDSRNTATPEALIALAKVAMADPVIAEIVAKPSVDLPGAGVVTNTNPLLADPGVVGIKTGTLDAWNLLSAKDITVGETTVRVYGAVLGQPDDAARLAVSRTLYSEVEAALQPVPSVAKGTVAGLVTTEWGEEVAIVTAQDASVILWNGGSGTVEADISLGDARDEGADVGTLAVTGPLDSTQTALTLAADIEPPSAWWRLTHPLDLFGLT